MLTTSSPQCAIIPKQNTSFDNHAQINDLLSGSSSYRMIVTRGDVISKIMVSEGMIGQKLWHYDVIPGIFGRDGVIETPWRGLYLLRPSIHILNHTLIYTTDI